MSANAQHSSLPKRRPERSAGRLHLAVEEVALNGFEGNLPVVVAQGHEVGTGAEVEEFVARPFGGFALEKRQEIVAVEVVFERLVAHHHAFQELFGGRSAAVHTQRSPPRDGGQLRTGEERAARFAETR